MPILPPPPQNHTPGGPANAKTTRNPQLIFTLSSNPFFLFYYFQMLFHLLFHLLAPTLSQSLPGPDQQRMTPLVFDQMIDALCNKLIHKLFSNRSRFHS